MDELQKLLRNAIADLTRPEAMLARIVMKKLREQGVEEASQHIAALEASLRTKLDDPEAADWSKLEIGTGESGLRVEGVQLLLESSDLDAALTAVNAAVEEAVPPLVEKLSKATLTRIKRDARKELPTRDSDRLEFERRLLSRWQKPLSLFSLEIAVAIQMGGEANRWLRRRPRKKQQAVIEALTRLHARACQIAGEIEVLLHAGFADGALARWRTLHEVAVVSWFILENGADAAERYLCHLDVAALDAATNFQNFASDLGYRPISTREMGRLRRRSAEVIRHFGKNFGNEYGWAAVATANPNPKFGHIEEAVKLSRLRPYYKLASANVHAGPRGAFFRIGLLPEAARLLLAGPSNAGLDEAGRLAAMSLANVTAALLLVKPTLDGIVSTKILFRLSEDIEAEFVKAHRRLVREEKSRQTHRRGKIAR